MASIERGIVWTHTEVLSLLDIWGDARVQGQLEGAKRNRKVFDEISKELERRGYERGPKQCRNKIKALKVEYKKEKDRLGKSGAARAITFKYFEVMDRLLGDRPSSQPHSTLDLGFAEDEEEEAMVDEGEDLVWPDETPTTPEREEETCVNEDVRVETEDPPPPDNTTRRKRQRESYSKEKADKKKQKYLDDVKELADSMIGQFLLHEEEIEQRRATELIELEERRMLWEEQMEERRIQEDRDQMSQLIAIMKEIVKK